MCVCYCAYYVQLTSITKVTFLGNSGETMIYSKNQKSFCQFILQGLNIIIPNQHEWWNTIGHNEVKCKMNDLRSNKQQSIQNTNFGKFV